MFVAATTSRENGFARLASRLHPILERGVGFVVVAGDLGESIEDFAGIMDVPDVDLADLHKEFGPRLEILYFPSDEFGAQELPENQVCSFAEKKGVVKYAKTISLGQGQGTRIRSLGLVSVFRLVPVFGLGLV